MKHAVAGLPARLLELEWISPRKLVFLSYVEEDSAVAHAIAEGLETKDYSTWLYERDCPTGADYFEETHKAISDCDAMIVLISPRSVISDQITREIVRAVESSKATLPLLLELSHDEYAKRRPGWKQAMAASNATRVSLDHIPTLIPSARRRPECQGHSRFERAQHCASASAARRFASA